MNAGTSAFSLPRTMSPVLKPRRELLRARAARKSGKPRTAAGAAPHGLDCGRRNFPAGEPTRLGPHRRHQAHASSRLRGGSGCPWCGCQTRLGRCPPKRCPGPSGDGRGILQRCLELQLDGGETFGIAGEKFLDRERLSAFALLQRTRRGRGSAAEDRAWPRRLSGRCARLPPPFEKQASPFLRTRHQRPQPAQTFATGRPSCQKASRFLAIRLNNLSAAHPPPSRRRGNRSCRRA